MGNTKRPYADRWTFPAIYSSFPPGNPQDTSRHRQPRVWPSGWISSVYPLKWHAVRSHLTSFAGALPSQSAVNRFGRDTRLERKSATTSVDQLVMARIGLSNSLEFDAASVLVDFLQHKRRQLRESSLQELDKATSDEAVDLLRFLHDS